MANLTPNYNLEKATENEYYDINVQNENMDKIDAALTPTADPAQVPTGNGPVKLVLWVSWLANRIKAIIGKANWYDEPDTSLAAAKAHIDAATPHAGHETLSGSQAKVDMHAGVAASTTIKGHIEVATNAEVTAGTDSSRAVTPAGLKVELDKKINNSLATAANDFLVASGAGAWVKKTLAEVKTILGLGSAAYTESSAYATAGHNHSGVYEPASSYIMKRNAKQTMLAEIDMADNLMTRPKIKDYSEVILADTTGTGTQTIDFSSANVHNITQTGAMTFSLTNPPASGNAGSATIRIKNGATVYAKTWPSSVKWIGDEIPAMDEANKIYDVVLTTFDGGVVYHGACIGPYSA